MASALFRTLLPVFVVVGIYACDGSDGFCEQEEDDLKSSDALNLLQTQTQLTMNGQPIQSTQAESDSTYSPPAGAAIDVGPPLSNKLDIGEFDKAYITDDKYGPFFSDDVSSGSTPSTCLATCLFGLSAVLVSIVYLVTLTHPVTQASMWSVLNKMVAAFIAALFVACYRDVTNYFTPTEIFKHYFLLGPALRFAAALLVCKLLLHVFKDEDSLIATATLGSFILGFTAIDLFDGILTLDGTQEFGVNFSQSPGSASVGSMCSVGLMLFVMWCFTVQRSKFEDSGSAQHGRWLEQNEEIEDDTFAITTGFLTCQVITFAFMAKLYPAIGMPMLSWETAIPYKSFGVMTLVYLVWLVIACNIWSFKRLKVLNQFVRIEYLVVRTVSMILGWCVLRWGQLVFFTSEQQWFGQSDPMLARLTAALAFTVGSLLVVFIVTNVIKDSKDGGTPDFYALSSSLGLLIGQSWMTCFYRASAGFGIPAVAPEGEANLLQRHTATKPTASDEGEAWDCLVQVAIIFALLLVVTPVWKTYIVSRVFRKEHGGKDTTPTPAIDALLGAGRVAR